MQLYDVFMLVVLVGTTVFGAWKGMAWQLASFASLVVSGGVAVHASPVIAPLLGSQAPWNRFLAMLILFLATSLAIWIVFRFVAKMIDRIQLKEFDRQMGALFGLLKGVVLCLVLTFFAVTLSEKSRSAVLDSKSGFYTARLIEHAGPLLPEEVRSVIGKYVDELGRGLQPGEMKSEESAIVEGESPLGGGTAEFESAGENRAAERGGEFLSDMQGLIDGTEGQVRRAGSDLDTTVQKFQDTLDRGVEQASETIDRGRGTMERVKREIDTWRSQSDDTFR